MAEHFTLGDPEYSDQKTRKVRPLLVISNSIFHQNNGLAVCAGITTNQKPHPYLIPITPKDVEGAMLEEQSQVMCLRISTVPCDKIVKKVARVTQKFYHTIIQKIETDVLEI